MRKLYVAYNCMLHTITCLDYYAMNRGIAMLVVSDTRVTHLQNVN